MASSAFSVASSLPPDEAYERLVDLTRVPEWDRGVAAVRRADGGDEREPGDGAAGGAGGAGGAVGAVGAVGARYEVEVTGFDGAPTTMVYEITEADAPHRFVMIGRDDTMVAVDTVTVRVAPDGSVVDYHATLELSGPHPPLRDDELDALFPKVAAVAEAGLAAFLNPAR